MPYKTFGCSICGKQAPTALRLHGTFPERMRWLRRHYKSRHPREFAKWYRNPRGLAVPARALANPEPKSKSLGLVIIAVLGGLALWKWKKSG